MYRLKMVGLGWLLLGGAYAADPASVVVMASVATEVVVAEGTVEAVRQSLIAPQVAGRVAQLAVKTGDRVNKGQLLVKIDRDAALQQARATQAQVSAAQAQLDVARKEFVRQQQLFQQHFISAAALDQAQAQLKATEAGVRGTLAQADAANIQTSFFTLMAPYSGVVSEVLAEEGDMAQPGKSLLTLYDPAEMRVVAPLAQSQLAQWSTNAAIRLEFPGLPEAMRWQKATTTKVLPAVDPASHTVQVRLSLPANFNGLAPGMFVRVYFPMSRETDLRLWLPKQAILRRIELTAVYVLDMQGQARLRQVRLGKEQDGRVEILSGLRAGERVALDPLSAIQARK